MATTTDTIDGPPVPEGWCEDALERPDSFGYFGDNKEMFVTWSLGPVIRHRDSGLLDQSNAAMLEQYLKSDESLAEDWTIGNCSHWAVGWVDHISFRVVEADGATPTRIARVLCEWFRKLREDYPVADEMDYSDREQDAMVENFQHALDYLGHTLTAKADTEDWIYEFIQWCDQTGHECCTENTDDQGAYPCDEHLAEGLRATGFLADEEGD